MSPDLNGNRFNPQSEPEDEVLRHALENKLGYAKERVTLLEAEILRWKRIAANLEQLIDAMFVNPSPEVATGNPLTRIPPTEAPSRFADMTLKQAIRVILQLHSEPMSVGDIYKALIKGGKQVGGKIPKDTVRAVLSNNPETFVRAEGTSHWMLASVPLKTR